MLGFGLDDVVVGSVANLSPMKGHRTFIHAAALLRRSHPETRFLLLGADYEYRPAYAKALWREAEALGLRLGRDLVVRDPGPHVADLAPALDVFWLSSEGRSEGIPTALGEAMALGLPVVATRVGGVPETVDDGFTGFLVPAEEPGALAKATTSLLEDAGLRRRMGERARARACERFSIEACVEAHLRAFAVASAGADVRAASPAHAAGGRDR
jgi:glycosyltransferase involved in cell wall biosynthesis